MSNLLAHKSVHLKKGTHGHALPKDGSDVRPDHTLVDRLQQWKHIDKSLLAYFQGLSGIQHTTAKATEALTHTIQVPFHEGHQFKGEGGWQEALYAVRDQTKRLGELHQNFADTIDKTVVKELEGVRAEIKSHIAAVEKEAGTLANDVDKERGISAQYLTQLQSGIDTYESSDSPMLPQHDPYLYHQHVTAQLKKQVHKENDLQSSLIRFQQQQPSFEESIAKNIQSACKLYDEAHATKTKEIADVHKEIAALLQKVEPTAEYEHYKSTENNGLIDPNAPTRSVEAIQFPGLNHASATSIKEGNLERKKRFTKSYSESYYVLTPSGYLHERKTSDPSSGEKPGFSLFLPECSLGPAAKEGDKSHKFHLEGNKAVKSSFESKVKNTLRFGGKEIAYTFRARTHAEMLGWWQAMDNLSRDTKTAVQPSSRVKSDPIHVAVANVGYESAEPATEPIRDTTKEGVEHNTETSHAVNHAALVNASHQQQTEQHHVEEVDDEESGGSSAEEEDEEMRQARTAPSTPGPGRANPIDEQVELSHKAETLPIYSGNTAGISTAEKAGLSEKAPILGNPINSNAIIPEASASTSTST